MPQKTYLSGPMTGYPNFNYATFERVAKMLRSKGWDIESPHENPAPEPMLEGQELWDYYMKLCHEQLLKCSAIILMNGWPESRGAVQEFQWALEEDLEVYYYDEWSERTILMSKPFKEANDG